MSNEAQTIANRRTKLVPSDVEGNYEITNYYMQNKPNFQKSQMNVSTFSQKDYENKYNWTFGENKPKQTQFQYQICKTNPNRTQFQPKNEANKPNQTQFQPKNKANKPNQTQFYLPSGGFKSRTPNSNC